MKPRRANRVTVVRFSAGESSADELLWNALGLEGWELVGVTVKHAAFKRRV